MENIQKDLHQSSSSTHQLVVLEVRKLADVISQPTGANVSGGNLGLGFRTTPFGNKKTNRPPQKNQVMGCENAQSKHKLNCGMFLLLLQ